MGNRKIASNFTLPLALILLVSSLTSPGSAFAFSSRAPWVQPPKAKKLAVIIADQGDAGLLAASDAAARALRDSGYEVHQVGSTEEDKSAESYARAVENHLVSVKKGDQVLIDLQGHGRMVSFLNALDALNFDHSIETKYPYEDLEAWRNHSISVNKIANPPGILGDSWSLTFAGDVL
ncbi:hypothetical protein WDW86_11035 [Bdellovibrionota bacterium FG-2]